MQKLLSIYFQDLPVEIHRLTGGATNTVFRVYCPKRQESVILRLFGVEEGVTKWINREQEHQLMESLGADHLVPRPLTLRLEGRLETYLPGRTLTPVDARPMISQIGTLIGQFHQQSNLLNPVHTQLFPLRVLQSWSQQLSSLLSSEAPAWQHELATRIPIEIQYLETLDYEKGICHNDLTMGNIIQTKHRLCLIDLEYGSLNFWSYDLANHLNEWRGLDLSLPPATPEERRRLCDEYLKTFDLSTDQLDPQINRLIIEVQNLIPTSHLLWSLWGIDQAKSSQLDFNYLEYAEQRAQMYLDSSLERI